jgi:hypothetical protein
VKPVSIASIICGLFSQAHLDVEKAFDKVWHDGLIFKLSTLNLPVQLINIIKSFLSNRSFYVKVDNQFSNVKPIQARVPQGSCLSPHLFSLYINDMPKHTNCKTALFADDALYLSQGRTNYSAILKLQQQLNLSQPWFDEWNITINPLKTSAIIFTNKPKSVSNKLKIKNNTINWSPSIKYLGVHLDNKLTFSKHIDYISKNFKMARYLLYPIISHNSPLSLSNKTFVYKTYLRPIITYASPIWASNISESNRNKLEVLQNTTLRTISGLPWFVSNQTIRNSTRVIPLPEQISIETNNLKASVINSPIPTIREISTKPCISPRHRNRPIPF